MRYLKIDESEVCNGKGVGISLFVSGCPGPHCKGCFNQSAWDFNSGKLWTKEVEEYFLNLVSREYIDRISILGGEPLASQNIQDIVVDNENTHYGLMNLVNKIRLLFPTKKLWLYTGYTWENFNEDQKAVATLCDVVVDGRFIEELKDLTLPFKGSSNQRLINVQETLKQGVVIEYGI